MAVYSFLNCTASIAGPGGGTQLASGAAAAEEGISFDSVEDKNIMTIGADGRGQHSLVASDACQLTVRLLKTSPANAVLQAMYDLQSASSALWGQNVITITDTARGDLSLFTEVAFKKRVPITYAKEGGINEWNFDAVRGNTVLGSGG